MVQFVVVVVGKVVQVLALFECKTNSYPGGDRRYGNNFCCCPLKVSVLFIVVVEV